MTILGSKTDILTISGAIDIPQKSRILSISMTSEQKFQKCARPSHRKTTRVASHASFKAICNYLVITRGRPNLDVGNCHIYPIFENHPSCINIVYQNAEFTRILAFSALAGCLCRPGKYKNSAKTYCIADGGGQKPIFWEFRWPPIYPEIHIF